MGRSSLDLYAAAPGPFEEIRQFNAYVGGCPTNIAVGARRLGLSTALLTALGEDLVGDFILNFLRREGVAADWIPRKKGKRTSAVLLAMEPPDTFPIVFYREGCADRELQREDVARFPLEDVRFLLLTGTGLSHEPSRSATFFAAERARGLRVQVLLDLDFRSSEWGDLLQYGEEVRKLLKWTDYCLGTEAEVRAVFLQEREAVTVARSQITSPEVEGDLEGAADRILQEGPGALVVKQGERGAMLYTKEGEKLSAPSFPVTVVNPLGAGDAFAAGFLYGLSQEFPFEESLKCANACGAYVVGQPGCANFMPHREELYSFLKEGR